MQLKIALLFIFLLQLSKHQAFVGGFMSLAGSRVLVLDLELLINSRPHAILFVILGVMIIVLVFATCFKFDYL